MSFTSINGQWKNGAPKAGRRETETFSLGFRYNILREYANPGPDKIVFRESPMLSRNKKLPYVNWCQLMLAFFIFFFAGDGLFSARSLTVPARTWGICFGNSPRFNGLRFNLSDKKIAVINGINVTLWKANEKNAGGTVNGLSLGMVPYAGQLNGIQVGLLGPGAEKNTCGVSIGLIGAGCGGDMTGLNIGGIGVGAGKNLKGISLGGIGAGAGDNMLGINIGGIGVGAGNDLVGLNLGGLGVGAGDKVMGITVAGLGAGAGGSLSGLTVCGLAAGAPSIYGITVAGLAVGGTKITGISLALGTIMVKQDKGEGAYTGLAVSAFNNIQGTQKGLAIGIVNYAYRLHGLQIGLVNIVRANPKGRKVLPIVNFNF